MISGVLTDPMTGKRVFLDSLMRYCGKVVSVGRGKDNDVPVGEHLTGSQRETSGRKYISRSHAQIELSCGENIFYIRDQGSMNGTFVKRKQVPTDEMGESSKPEEVIKKVGIDGMGEPLKPGDTILLGTYELKFEIWSTDIHGD